MTLFWISAAALIAVVLALILLPLLRPVAAPGRSRAELNLSIHRERLRELDEDLKSGALAQDQYDQARTELERDVLDDVGGTVEDGRVEQAFWARWAAVVVGLLVPVFAVSLYLMLQPDGLDDYVAGRMVAAAPQGEGMHDMSGAVERLAERLKQNPDDAEGWYMLGRSYAAMDRPQEAVRAFAQARRIAGDVPEILAELAEATALAGGGRLDGEPFGLLELALKQNPTHPKSLWLAGVASFQRGDARLAIGYWERLRSQLPEGGQEAQALDAYLQEARAQAGTAPKAEAKPAAAPAAPGKAIRVRVELAPEIASKVKPDDVVFVFARPAQGPRMPLAVIRTQVRELPGVFTLDDSSAMSPSMALSTAATVIVGARVSRSGQPTPSPGDFEGDVANVKVGARETVRITIARTL